MLNAKSKAGCSADPNYTRGHHVLRALPPGRWAGLRTIAVFTFPFSGCTEILCKDNSSGFQEQFPESLSDTVFLVTENAHLPTC